MKKALFCLVLFWGFRFAHADQPWDNFPPGGYKAQHDILSIITKTPPGVLYVEDSVGRRTGINPAHVADLDQNGILKNPAGYWAEIPLSANDQQNVSNDETSQSQAETPYSVDILDGGNQTYTVHLLGLIAGVQDVIIQDSPVASTPQGIQSEVSILLGANQKKNFEISVNTRTYTASITRTVKSDDLLSDVQSACQVDLIHSQRACEFLTLQAKLIARALDKQHDEEAKAGLWVFLHALGYSRPFGCRDEDHHDEVKQPALSILQEDAKALLTQIGQPTRHFREKGR